MKEEDSEDSFDSQSGSEKNQIPGWLTANCYYYPALFDERKTLKKYMTEPEKILWEKLRNKQTGYKFRRQHVIDVFVVDFVCLPEKLVIEVDGGIHKKQKDYDNMREDRLRVSGYSVLRFTNDEVTENVNLVCQKIRDFLEVKNVQTPPGLPEGEG